jgi:hypothetical protein
MTKNRAGLRPSLALLGAVLALLAWRARAGAEGPAADREPSGVPQVAMMASSYQLQLATLSSAR